MCFLLRVMGVCVCVCVYMYVCLNACSLGSVSWNSDYLQLWGPELKIRTPSVHQGPIHTPLRLLPSTSFLLFLLSYYFLSLQPSSFPCSFSPPSLILSLSVATGCFFPRHKGAQEQDECAVPFFFSPPNSSTCIY